MEKSGNFPVRGGARRVGCIPAQGDDSASQTVMCSLLTRVLYSLVPTEV